MIFLFAGLDTTSNGISHLLHRLAIHDDIKNKLQKEIDDYMLENDGKIEYLSINKLKYLDMVLSGLYYIIITYGQSWFKKTALLLMLIFCRIRY